MVGPSKFAPRTSSNTGGATTWPSRKPPDRIFRTACRPRRLAHLLKSEIRIAAPQHSGDIFVVTISINAYFALKTLNSSPLEGEEAAPARRHYARSGAAGEG